MTSSGRMPFIKGGLVNLYGLRREDLEPYREWIENRSATFFMETGWRPPSDADMDALFKSSTGPSDVAVFGIVPENMDRPVGIVGLYAIQWICRRAEFRILLGDDVARGRGYGTAAAKAIVDYGFDLLNLETIYLGVNTENTGAIRSYEKAGFRREGIRRKLIYRNSRYYDALMMSILREEWAKDKAERAP